jgi:hypothetical protein
MNELNYFSFHHRLYVVMKMRWWLNIFFDIVHFCRLHYTLQHKTDMLVLLRFCCEMEPKLMKRRYEIRAFNFDNFERESEGR